MFFGFFFFFNCYSLDQPTAIEDILLQHPRNRNSWENNLNLLGPQFMRSQLKMH